MAGSNYTTRLGRIGVKRGFSGLFRPVLFWTSEQWRTVVREDGTMRRIRMARFDSTSVEESETTRIAAGQVETSRRQRVTRTTGSFFELLFPGLSMSGSVTVTNSHDMPAPERQKLLRANDPKALPNQTIALEGPKQGGKRRLLK
jgi:hypothetical protein